MKNCIVAVAGDLHVNSTVALCPPKFNLDDGGTYVASKQQRWIWNHWIDYWNHINELKKQGYHIYAVLNGELVDDLKHQTTQLITRNKADMIRLSIDALQPCLNVADCIIVTRGTEAHSGPSSNLDEAIACEIGAYRDGDKDPYSRQLFRADINGIRYHITHHPGMGHGRHWTKGADAARLALDIYLRYKLKNMDHPHLAIFGHTHKDVDSYKTHPTRAIVFPSWQLSNAFGYRIGGGWLKIGGGYYIDDGDGFKHENVKEFFTEWPIESWKRTTLNLHMTS